MPTHASGGRQQTQDLGSDSGEEIYDEENGNDPKNKKKGSSTQAARRDQNRIAQREFRLRKQQRIRDLELRVELLSANKDEAFTALDGMLQDLNRENQALRQLVKELSSFIGEGIGGFLPKLGWDINSFEEFKNRSETDTMNDSFQHRKKNPGQPAPVVPLLAGQKRRTEELPGLGRKKSKPNTAEDSLASADGQHPSYSQPPSIYPNSHPSTSSSNVYNQTTYRPSAPSNVATFSSSRTSLPPQISTSVPNVPPAMYNTTPTSSVSNNSYTHPVRVPSSDTVIGHPPLPKRDEASTRRHEEAAKMIHYHLQNYKRNPAYCLPASLRPTHVQRTIAHDFIIDGIPIPDLRDKMILYKNSFDLAECVHTLMSTTIIHSDDVLSHANWELSEEWFLKFGRLGTKGILECSNKWRRERGDSEIPQSLIATENDESEPHGT